jgi:hypothetical protein
MRRGLPQARAFTAKAACCSACFLLTFSPAIASAGTYSGGLGEPNDPFRISTPEDLNDIGNHEDDWDKHFILDGDVNLASYTGVQFNLIGGPYDDCFAGVFDGNDHTIANFTFTSPDSNFVGLFVSTCDECVIRNLRLQNVRISGNDIVGGLVGVNRGTISRCYGAGSVSGNQIVGGVVGVSFGTLADCSADSSVVGLADETGGLVGSNYGMLLNCHAGGSVLGLEHKTGGLVGENVGEILDCSTSAVVDGNYTTGGLVGENRGTILRSYSNGSVCGDGVIGGLVGENMVFHSAGMISRCFAGGTVKGDVRLGGLAGWNVNGTITDCYARSDVSGNAFVGGLVGDGGRGAILYSHAVGNVSGSSRTGGLIGGRYEGSVVTSSFWDTQTTCQITSDGGTSKTTPQMQIMSTFTDAGWDFIEVWDIGENQTYPFLRKYAAGDINHDGVVDFRDIAHLAADWLGGVE